MGKELIKVICEKGRQAGKAIYRVPVITIKEYREFFASFPMMIAPAQKWDEYYKRLAEYVPEWEFVDSSGQQLPHPKDDFHVFDQITSDELAWITTQGLIGTPKN